MYVGNRPMERGFSIKKNKNASSKMKSRQLRLYIYAYFPNVIDLNTIKIHYKPLDPIFYTKLNIKHEIQFGKG